MSTRHVGNVNKVCPMSLEEYPMSSYMYCPLAINIIEITPVLMKFQPYIRVATAQGKRNLAVNFSRQGKHREFSKFNFLHRENCGNTGKILKI